MSIAIRKYLIEIIAALVTLPLISLGGLYLWSLSPPIKYGGVQELEPPVVCPGQTVFIVRDLEITRPTILTIVRNFEHRLPDGRVEVLEGLDVRIAYVPGVFRQKRIFTIPTQLPPGEWVLRNQVTWEDWPGFTHTINAAPIKFTVKEKT